MDLERLRECESHGGFRRKHNVLVASEGRAAGSGTAAGNCADGRALSVTGQTADQCAERSAAARHDGRTLTFTFSVRVTVAVLSSSPAIDRD